MVFAHGFGCSQEMWRYVAPQFEREFVTVLFDHVGAGQSDVSAYAPQRYSSLEGYARDVVELGQELHFEDAIFVGHSCGAMIGALASIQAPKMFQSLVLISPSPRYINDARYTGGFSQNEVDELLAALRKDYPAWTSAMAPVFMGNADRPELAEELLDSFRRIDPKIAADFGRTIFNSDLRSQLPQVEVDALVLQSADDVVVPVEVGDYLVRQIPKGRLETLNVQGHFPHLCAPAAVVAAIRRFIGANRPARPLAAEGLAGWQTLAETAEIDSAAENPDADERSRLEDLLLRRVGELVSHLGRYDMYALGISSWLASGDSAREQAADSLTLRTRGAFISESMERRAIVAGLRSEFAAINTQLLGVLARHEIAARNSAVMPDLTMSKPEHDSNIRSNPRDWYDYDIASDEELTFFIDSMERDIVEIASLYLRLADCGAVLRRKSH